MTEILIRRSIVMAVIQPGLPPERQIIRDVIAERLIAIGYCISNIDLYHIRLQPHVECNLSLPEITNLPKFWVAFEEDGIYVRYVRATGDRLLATIEYADPLLFEKLISVLEEIGVCLTV